MKLAKSLGLSLSLIALLGCSSSNDSNTNTESELEEDTSLPNSFTGYLIDSGVAGLKYQCSLSNAQGITDVNGSYTCDDGEDIEFKICEQSLGSIAIQEYITPAVIFPGDKEAALNLAQLLQSLDKDNNPSNGIELDTSICSSVTQMISFTSPDFDLEMHNMLQEHNRTLVSEGNASKHLNDTFVTLDINDDGTYPRTYTWRVGAWGSCVGACGTDNATQTRDVSCQDIIGTIDETKCNIDTKQETTQSCTASICPLGTPNQAPVFTSDATVSVSEDVQPIILVTMVEKSRIARDIILPTVVLELSASDPENDAITYSISGGADANSFDVNASTGEVYFTESPDYESTKRIYFFTATATDTASNTDTMDINVSITDVADREHFHNEVKYAEVDSNTTNRIWLDRNLGASQDCNASDDIACYGGYYQWGRDHDGHENNTSDINDTLALSITPMHNKFITNSNTPSDWVAPGLDDDGSLRSANWSNIDGSSVCPVGFRVPTSTELTNENLSGNEAGFNSPLKLPFAGQRKHQDGVMRVQGHDIYIWSSSVDVLKSDYLELKNNSSTTISDDTRGYGLSVRCIKEIQ